MSFLIPIGVVFYAAIGGLKATFTTSYMHTVIVYVVALYFLFKACPCPTLSGNMCLCKCIRKKGVEKNTNHQCDISLYPCKLIGSKESLQGVPDVSVRASEMLWFLILPLSSFCVSLNRWSAVKLCR